jgi:hypothetical protein
MKISHLSIPIAVSMLLLAVAICKPELILKNDFIKEFIVHDTLNIMAVIMTIAIATVATIHIWFNELERKYKQKIFAA